MRLCCLLLAFASMSAIGSMGWASDQDPLEPSIGGIVAENLESAFHAAQDANQNANLATSDIDAARKRYWKAYSSGSNLAQAEAEFSQQLWVKDLYYVTISLPEGLDGDVARMVGTIARIDGGIRPAAYPAFKDWVVALREELGARGANDLVVLDPVRLLKAISTTQDRYVAYKRARDRAELEASGLDLKRHLTVKQYALQLLEARFTNQEWAPGIAKPNPANQAAKTYDVIASVLGEDAVNRAANTVLQARKDREGELASEVEIDQPQGGKRRVTSPVAWFESLLYTSDKGYAFGLIRNSVAAEYEAAWQLAATSYRETTARYGEAAVSKAAARVRSAPKRSDGQIADQSGQWLTQRQWFDKILENPATQIAAARKVRFDVTDADGIKGAGKNAEVIVRGVVSAVTPSGNYLHIHFEKVTGDAVSAMLVSPYWFEKSYGQGARGLIGKSIEITADFWVNDGSVLLRVVNMAQIRVVPG